MGTDMRKAEMLLKYFSGFLPSRIVVSVRGSTENTKPDNDRAIIMLRWLTC